MIKMNCKTCLTIFLAMLFGWIHAEALNLPNFNTANLLDGKAVTNFNAFVPTYNDFTLEVKAKAHVAIELKFGQISYTPTQDGVVRFVQKDGTLYVFENNRYVKTITPIYKYVADKNNLLRNGSFESVAEQLASGRWKAQDWETWDGGTPTWGGDVSYVNVRENANYCSDGKKSIILHSRSRWLSQELAEGTLSSNGVYLFSCDYWTSEGSGNGNGSYKLLLGSSLAGDDLLRMDAYTTLENEHKKQSFSTIFQAPVSLPSSVFLSLYRAESKVDWLDNVKLVKVSVEESGLMGTDSAVYTTGAYAPKDMVLPEDVYIDMTSRCVNPNFDDGTMVGGAPTGWNLDAKVTQSKISTIEKSGGVIAGNQNHWQIWHDGSALTGKAYQRLTNMPNGRYLLSADVCTAGFGGSVNLYANYGKTSIVSNAGKRYTVAGVCVDGTLEIGLSFHTTGGTTIDFDHFTLQYVGMDIEGYRESLLIKEKEAEDALSSLEDGYDATLIEGPLAVAKALGDDASSEDIIDAIAQIDQALADYQKYVEERVAERKKIEQFAAMLHEAKQERNTEEYPAADDFDKAIEQAENFLEKLKLTPSLPVTDAARQLNAAREEYYNSQYTIQPVKQAISAVDLSLDEAEKYVLRVDGTPFYPTEIQLRADKLRGYEGWTENEIEAAFKRAADDGFNTLSIPVFWSEVEPEKDHFDWRLLDRYMGWCKKYGMKMELLWFSWSSGGRVQYLVNYNGKQQLRTPDYVCSMEGTSEFNMLRKEWEYSLDWRDKNLMAREKMVLGKVMEHVALWDANNGNPHTVIGVQLGNEARSHGNNSATSAEIINYYHQVGAAVKDSKYVTWTRLNCVSYETSGRTSANENKRNNGGTNIDFVGIDIYGTNASKVKGNMDGQLGSNGKNFRMIMEIDAKDANSPIYQMAALAGDKAFDYYNLGPVDGNGLYSNDGHRLAERSHITLVRQRNKILNLANQDIALRSQGKGLYVYNYSGGSTNSEAGLWGISFAPTIKTTQAVAVRHGESFAALLATEAGKFVIPSSLNVTSAQAGYFDANNHWVKEKNATISNNTVTMTEASCVLLVLDGKEGELDTPATDVQTVEELHSLCVADTLLKRRQKWYNRDEMLTAFEAYHQMGTDAQAITHAANLLKKAHENFQQITADYKQLRSEVNSFKTEIARTYFAYKDSISNMRTLINSYYSMDEDHYEWVKSQLASLQIIKALFQDYNDLLSAINKGKIQLRATQYPGMAQMQTVLDASWDMAKKATRKEQFVAQINAINDAIEAYLKSRPSEWITIKNGQLWKTDKGATVQAHAPGFVRVGDVWYMCGEDRTQQWNPDVSLYSSVDLVHWKFEKKIIQNGVTTSELGKSRMIERPKLLYNKKTHKFVVWCHYEASNYGASEAACFECDSVNGAYKYVWSGRPLGIKSRDCNVFQDNDGTAYFISTTEENRHLGLFRLSDDYHEAVEHTQLFANQGREAPAIVRIDNTYFMFSSACSGWDPNQCKLSHTTNLKSGWSGLVNIGNKMAYDTQAAAILEIKGTKATTYLYVGDRWQDPGLPESKTIMFPITFDGNTCKFTYHERFDINFVTGEWRETPSDTFIDKKNWKVIGYSSQEDGSGNAAKNAIDGNQNTMWHTKYSGGVAEAPHDITIDLGGYYDINSFIATPRMDGDTNGLIRKYQFQVSRDGEKWTTVSSGSWLPYCTEVDAVASNYRYVKLVCTEGTYASLAELDLIGTPAAATGVEQVKTSDDEKQIVSRKLYLLDGKEVSDVVKGIYLEKQFLSDGSTRTLKRIKR